MGMIQHKTLCVTSSFPEMLQEVRHKLVVSLNDYSELNEDILSDFVGVGMNGYTSFYVAPCGSKLGWEMSDQFDQFLEKAIDIIDTLKYEDGSSSIDYVLVSYGEFGANVEDTNCKNQY